MEGKKFVIGLVALVVLSMIVLVVTTFVSPPPKPPIVVRAIDANDLPERNTRAAQLVETSCITCHAIPDPKSHVASEWSDVYQRMVIHGQARAMSPIVLPSGADAELVVDYLRRHAAVPKIP